MSNPGIEFRDTLRSLENGECLEFTCGRCRRVGEVALLQLVKLGYAPDPPLIVVERNSYFRRCGCRRLGNRVGIIDPRR